MCVIIKVVLIVILLKITSVFLFKENLKRKKKFLLCVVGVVIELKCVVCNFSVNFFCLLTFCYVLEFVLFLYCMCYVLCVMF